jgi:hypothetical protein
MMKLVESLSRDSGKQVGGAADAGKAVSANAFLLKTIIVVIEHLRIALVPQQTKLLTKSSGGMHGNDKRLNPPQGSTQTSQAG